MSIRVSFVTDLNALKHVSSNIIRLRRSVKTLIEGIFQCNVIDYKEIPVEKLPDENLFDFINSDLLIIDFCDKEYQNELNYNLGTRDSFGRPDNIIVLEPLIDRASSTKEGSGIYIAPFPNNSNFHHIKYYSFENELFYDNPNTPRENYRTSFYDDSKRLYEFFDDQINAQFPESKSNNFICELEKLRTEKNQAKVELLLQKIIHSEPPTPDIIFNVLVIFRDLRNYDYMIKVCDYVSKCWDEIKDQNILYQYAFALNRRNHDKDREKALKLVEKLQQKNLPPPDTYGLLGRIYKDMYLSTKTEKYLIDAIKAYRAGFERHQSEYLGINLASLLDIDDRKKNQMEIDQICTTITQRLGRKGELSKVDDYWSAAIYFETSILTDDFRNANKSAERMYKLKPISWTLETTLKNVEMIFKNRQLTRNTLDYNIFNAWITFFREWVYEKNTQIPDKELADFDGDTVFTVLYLYDGDPHPALLQVNLNVEPQNLHLRTYDYSIMDDNTDRTDRYEVIQLRQSGSNMQTKEYNPVDACIQTKDIIGIMFSKKDLKDIFLYTLQYGVFFHIQFGSESSRQKFSHFIEQSNITACQENQENLKFEYEYEKDANGQRICLGQGSFGKVFSGLSNGGPIAIKEFTNVTKDIQPIREEILLHSRLSHKNIVVYLGAAQEDNVFKIFMERVQGDTLTKISRSFHEFPEKSCSVYSRQILEGIKYLHKNKIIHRDIKSQNILVDKFTGTVKITDFGESRTYGIFEVKDKIFAGTTRYMAPEILFDKKWSFSADIWSFGCTVVEMITGKLPYYEYSDVPLFKIGKYRIHPTIPEETSPVLKDFLSYCFDKIPENRHSASKLLNHKFIKMYNKTKEKSKYQTNMLPHTINNSSFLSKYERFNSEQPLKGSSADTFEINSMECRNLIDGSYESFLENREMPWTNPRPEGRFDSSYESRTLPIKLRQPNKLSLSMNSQIDDSPSLQTLPDDCSHETVNSASSPSFYQDHSVTNSNTLNDSNCLTLKIKSSQQKFSNTLKKNIDDIVDKWHEYLIKIKIEITILSQEGLNLTKNDLCLSDDGLLQNPDSKINFDLATITKSDHSLKVFIERWLLRIMLEIIIETMLYQGNCYQANNEPLSPFKLMIEIFKYSNESLNNPVASPDPKDPLVIYKTSSHYCRVYDRLMKLIMKLHKNKESLDGVKTHNFKPNQINKYHFEMLKYFVDIIPKDGFLPHEYTTFSQIITDGFSSPMLEIVKTIIQIDHRDPKKNELRRTRTLEPREEAKTSNGIAQSLSIDSKNSFPRPVSLYQNFGLSRLSIRERKKPDVIREVSETAENTANEPQKPNNSEDSDPLDVIAEEDPSKFNRLLKSINNLIDPLDNLYKVMSNISENFPNEAWASQRSKQISEELMPITISSFLDELSIPDKDQNILKTHFEDDSPADFINYVEREDLWRMNLSCSSIIRIWCALQKLRKID